MTQCPEFTTIKADTNFLSAGNIKELVPDVFTRTIGTVVNVSCREFYQLNGQSRFTCMSNGQWSFLVKPTCTQGAAPTTTTPSSEVDEDTKILIGVVCGLAALIVIVLIAMLIVVRLRDRRRRRRNDDLRRTMMLRDRPDTRRYRSRNHDDISTVDDVYSRGSAPPPYRYNDWNQPSRSYRPDYEKQSQRSGPMYLPRAKTNYEDYYDKLKDSRKRPKSLDEEFEKKGSKPYVRDWMRRTSREREDYSRPYVHGRGGSNDSQLWRQAY